MVIIVSLQVSKKLGGNFINITTIPINRDFPRNFQNRIEEGIVLSFLKYKY